MIFRIEPLILFTGKFIGKQTYFEVIAEENILDEIFYVY